jgi:peptide/nickel transport system substrate-binding protein
VVAVTLVVVAILLLSQQPVVAPILPEAAPGGVYAEALIGSMGRLNPMLDWNNPADRDVNRLIFSGLIRFDARGLPQPDLAESWGTSADGTLYNFSLRPSAAWHDGTPVTSGDVIFTIDTIRSTGSLFPEEIKQLWSEIEIRELNSQTLQMRLPEPYAPFLDFLTFGLLPKHILQSVPAEQLASSDFNLNPVGTGPYRFDHLLVDGGQITGVVLVANRNFYLPSAFIEQIVFRYYPDSSSALAAYEQGEVLGVSQITSELIPKALADPALSIYTSRLPQMSIVFLNLNNPAVAFLQNRTVRQALMLGLNRKAIVSRILQGQAIIADGPILPGSWAYYEALERIDYDPDAAVSLLKREGYLIPAEGGEVRAKEGEVLRLTLLHPDDPLHTEIALSVQEDWSAIGVQVELQALGYDQLAGEYLASRNYMAALVDLNLERSPDPDPYLFWHQAEATGGQNYSQWDNRTASEYLEAARTQTDFTDRTRLYRNFQVIFSKELPSLPLYYPVYSYAVDAQVRGVQVAPLYEPSDRMAFVRDWYLVTRRTLERSPQVTLEP